MKKVSLLVMVVLMLFSTLSFSQSVNDVNVKDFNSEFIELVGTSKFMSNKVTISVDYGQERKFFKSQVIKDNNGIIVVFYGMIDAMNFFSKYGYDFKQAYTVSMGNNLVYHWLLEKRHEK